MGKIHVVRQGDHISAIVGEHGFGDFKRIWDHPENAALAAVRDPHALMPGDRIAIPEREEREERGGTGAVHRFVADVPKLFLRVKLLDVDGRSRPKVECDLDLPAEAPSVEKTADADGIVEDRIPRAASLRGRLVAKLPRPAPQTGTREARYDLHVGDLDPHTEFSGQQARFSNLGYFAGFGALDLDALVWAAEEFRCDQGTKRAKTRSPIKPPPPAAAGEPPLRDPGATSGIDDSALVAKLLKAHGN